MNVPVDSKEFIAFVEKTKRNFANYREGVVRTYANERARIDYEMTQGLCDLDTDLAATLAELKEKCPASVNWDTLTAGAPVETHGRLNTQG